MPESIWYSWCHSAVVWRILEEKNRIYTQIKIDEITNLGAVKIRLRSLFAALGLGKEAAQ